MSFIEEVQEDIKNLPVGDQRELILEMEEIDRIEDGVSG